MKMSCRYLEKVLSKQGNSKTIVRCLEDVLCRLGLMLIERWKFYLNKQGFAGALLMDLSKAFDTINHELLIAKLHTYGSSTDALEVLISYSQDRWQKAKINATFSSWTHLLQGVPQRSVLGPILFNIYINDIFFPLERVDKCSFADDTTPCVCNSNLKSVLETLEHSSESAIAWFEMNYMKLNTDKCHVLISRNKMNNCEQNWIEI